MKLILVEFSWHAKEIVNKKESFKSDVVVSLNPESSYILKINKIQYFETYEFCNHKELWLKYNDLIKRSIKITEILDKVLWKIDERFKKLNWQFFDDYHYPIKISFDQLFYYSELISKITKKFKPSEIVVADTNKVKIDKHWFLINSEISIIKYLLQTHKEISKKTKISFVYHNNKRSILNSIDNLKIKVFFNFVEQTKQRVRNIYFKFNFLFNFYRTKPKYLSIGCLEILRYKKSYPSESKLFLSYFHNQLNKNNFINDSKFISDFMDYLKNNTNFFDLIKHEDISFKPIFKEILIKILQRRDFMIREYKKARKIIKKMKPRCVIFQSMTPFYFPNIIFRQICKNYKIPFVTWSHGGYGLVNSLPGYDVTDFKFCKNHISYGSYLKDFVDDSNCILKQLNIGNNHNVMPVGSARLDYDNRKKNLKKNLKTNNKKTIVFFKGMPRDRNKHYFGRNRKKNETSLWELHYDILYLLKKYKNKYNIIFKDYPNGRKSLWKSVLKDIDADKISYISNEYTVNDLLRISDLNILPWISTTFFEALYFNADIFVIEEDVFEKAFEQKLKNEIFYYENVDKFKLNLERYLEEGQFYKYKKDLSKSYLLDFDNFNRRDKVLNEVLDNFSKN